MKARTIWLLAGAGLVALASGCAVARQARDLPGTDPQLIQPGADRVEVERALGSPLRTWQPNERVTYQLRIFRSPLKGSRGDAAALAVMDVTTLGLFELMAAIDRKDAFARDAQQPLVRLWFGFNADGHLFGVYPEYAVLPEQPQEPASPLGSQ